MIELTTKNGEAKAKSHDPNYRAMRLSVIMGLREQGKSYTLISKLLGVSGGRVAQIESKAIRMERFAETKGRPDEFKSSQEAASLGLICGGFLESVSNPR